MNKFDDMLKAFRTLADEDEQLRDVLRSVSAVKGPVLAEVSMPRLRLPYSSDPKPVGDAWN